MLSRCAALLALLASPALAVNQPLRVASWNIHQARNPQAIRTALEHSRLSEDCDVLLLQEAPFGQAGELAAAVARERGWHFFQNASNAILSRWPISRSGVAVIGVSRTRELPWADIASPSGNIRVYSIHLTFRDGGLPFEEELRFQEISWILYHLEKTEPLQSPADPVIIAGDFNTVGSVLWGHQREKGLRLLHERGFGAGPGSGATHLLFGRLDWIYAKGLLPVDGGVGEFSGADHRWLWAAFKPGDGRPLTRVTSATGVSTVWYGLPLVLLAGVAMVVRQRPRRPR